jgi:hypothetical protein
MVYQFQLSSTKIYASPFQAGAGTLEVFFRDKRQLDFDQKNAGGAGNPTRVAYNLAFPLLMDFEFVAQASASRRTRRMISTFGKVFSDQKKHQYCSKLLTAIGIQSLPIDLRRR